MRFGGHETFSIREGWLYKGMDLLLHKPDLLVDEYAADWLGVGRNMAKSIRHWLVATGLALVQGSSRKASVMEPTPLGKMIFENDPYCLEIGTWWILHNELIHSRDQALTWHWFFNYFRDPRFEKAVALEALKRYVAASSARMPSPKTLERDLACLLSSYSQRIPPTSDDPEEAIECPMIELDLMAHFRDTGTYVMNVEPKKIPHEVLGYAFAKAFQSEFERKGHADILIMEAISAPNAPGAVFGFNPESLFETLHQKEESSSGIEIVGLASQRGVRIPSRTPLEWVARYYQRVKEDSRAA